MDSAAGEAASSSGLFTPFNVILLGVVAYTSYLFFKPSKPATLPRHPPATVFKTYTPRTLLPFNGEDNMPVFMAVRGQVFDVSRGRNFYGPGGPYANFAGRDATRGLACNSFDREMLTENLDGPLDKLEDLGPEEMEALQGWHEMFQGKYDIVGKLVTVDEYKQMGKE